MYVCVYTYNLYTNVHCFVPTPWCVQNTPWSAERVVRRNRITVLVTPVYRVPERYNSAPLWCVQNGQSSRLNALYTSLVGSLWISNCNGFRCLLRCCMLFAKSLSLPIELFTVVIILALKLNDLPKFKNVLCLISILTVNQSLDLWM